MVITLAVLEVFDIIVFSVSVLFALIVLIATLYIRWWLQNQPPSLSPYTKLPLRSASDLSYDAKVKVLRYLFNLKEYDNRIFEFRKSAVCRETGRIFPNCVTWYGAIKVDWSFLNKRFPGRYVSWGSLTEDQQLAIRDSHDSLEGYQTEFSSPEILPKNIEAKYAFAKPGPLYVDIENNILLGWKSIPDTDLEFLIVQKPIKYITISIT